MKSKRSGRAWRYSIVTIWLFVSFFARIDDAVTSEDIQDKGIDKEAITKAPEGASSGSSSTSGPALEIVEPWTPEGSWLGKYRLRHSDVIDVSYKVGAAGHMTMVLDLSPRRDWTYEITSVDWSVLKVEFSKDETTHCLLSRTKLNDPFEGECKNYDGDVVVPFISIQMAP